MLANFFGKSKPVNFILIAALFLVYYFIAVLKLDSFRFSEGFFLSKMGNLFLFLMLFFFYNFILGKNRLTRDNSYAFLIFIVFFGVFLESMLNFKMLILHFFLLLFFRKIYSFRSLKSILAKLFDSGLWLGVAFILEPFTVVYFCLLYMAIFIFYEITIRTILIPVLAFSIPVFLYFTYCFFTDSNEAFYSLFDFITTYDFSVYSTLFYTLSFSIFSFFILISILIRSPKVFSVNNRFRRSWVLVLIHLLCAIVFVIILKTRNGSELIAVSIPASIIIANWLQIIERKWLTNVVLLFLLVYSFAIHFII